VNGTLSGGRKRRRRRGRTYASWLWLVAIAIAGFLVATAVFEHV
jgi:hypothetical protein